jgi:hypothetical protein
MTAARSLPEAARKAASARQALEDAIREEHAKGTSLRKLAVLTGMSHETVRRIVAS